MSEYEGKKEAAVKGPEEVDMPSSELEDSFNVLFNVIVAETETNEIDNEFTEAVSEIEGKKSFECEKCGKVCKSKGGLTRHTNSKHAEPNTQSETTTKLDKDTVDGFVEAIKAGIIDEGLYENSTVTALETVTTTEALYISCCSSHL